MPFSARGRAQARRRCRVARAPPALCWLALLILAGGAQLAAASPVESRLAYDLSNRTAADDAFRAALESRPELSQDLAQLVTFEGSQRPRIVLMVAPCRSGTTAMSRAVAYTGTTVVYQKIKEALRLMLVERLRGQLTPEEESYFHVDSTPEESLRLPRGTPGDDGVPTLFLKETFGGAHPLESYFDPLTVLLSAGWAPRDVTLVTLAREPLASFASWVKHWGQGSESGHGGASLQQLLVNYRLAMAATEHAHAVARRSGVRTVSLDYEALSRWAPHRVLATLLRGVGLRGASRVARTAAGDWDNQPLFLQGHDPRMHMPKGDDHIAYLGHVHRQLLQSAGLAYTRKTQQELLRYATPQAAAVLHAAVLPAYLTLQRRCEAALARQLLPPATTSIGGGGNSSNSSEAAGTATATATATATTSIVATDAAERPSRDGATGGLGATLQQLIGLVCCVTPLGIKWGPTKFNGSGSTEGASHVPHRRRSLKHKHRRKHKPNPSRGRRHTRKRMRSRTRSRMRSTRSRSHERARTRTSPRSESPGAGCAPRDSLHGAAPVTKAQGEAPLSPATHSRRQEGQAVPVARSGSERAAPVRVGGHTVAAARPSSCQTRGSGSPATPLRAATSPATASRRSVVSAAQRRSTRRSVWWTTRVGRVRRSVKQARRLVGAGLFATLAVSSICLQGRWGPIACASLQYVGYLAAQTPAFRAADLYVQWEDMPAMALGVMTCWARVLPTVYVIGAQKAGTSALHGMLLQHPDVLSGLAKETHFVDGRSVFGTTFHGANGRSDAGSTPLPSAVAAAAGPTPRAGVTAPLPGAAWAYRSFFPTRLYTAWRSLFTGRSPAVVDATPVTMMLPHAAPMLHALTPQAKLVAVLRDRAHRLWSHYRHNVRWGREHRPLREALARELQLWQAHDAAAAAGQPLPPVTTAMMEASYLHRGLYSRQLAAFRRGLPLLVLSSFDVLTNASTTMDALFRFLDLPPHPVTALRANSGSHPRHAESATAVPPGMAPHDARWVRDWYRDHGEPPLDDLLRGAPPPQPLAAAMY